MELEDRPLTFREDVLSLELHVRSSRYQALALVKLAGIAGMPERIVLAAKRVSTELLTVNRLLDDLGEFVAEEDAKRFTETLPGHVGSEEVR